MKETKPKCRWCHRTAINSHITPKSVHRTAKAVIDANVKDMRMLLAPNRIVQDLSKVPLLCTECDNSFSTAEGKFRQEIYEPLLNGATKFQYGEWLQRFAVSIAWKRLVTGIKKLDVSGMNPALPSLADEAASSWENYLRGNSSDSGHFAHHLYFTWFINRSELPEASWMLFRTSFDSTLIPANGGILVQTTFPGCVLFSGIFAPGVFNANPFDGTQIFQSGSLNDNQIMSSHLLTGWADRCLNDIQRALKLITPTQRQKIVGSGCYSQIR